MNLMYFRYFTDPSGFPLFLYYALHDKDFEMHTHVDFSELVVVLDGTAMHCVGNEVYFVKRGDVFVVNGDTEHGYKNTDHLRICNIMYHPEIISSPFFDIRKSTGFHALFVVEPFLSKSQDFKSRLTLNVNDFEQTRTLLTIMMDEYEKKIAGWQTLVQALFMTLITMLSRLYCLSSYDIKRNILNIAKTVAYIESHFKEPISVSDLAASSNISERHFLRVFKDTYRTTPSNYIVNLRLQYACQLLKNTSLKISEIALQSGFNDYNYFTRRFCKAFGVTPSRYRAVSIDTNYPNASLKRTET